MLCLLPSPSGKLGHDSLPELSNHFSVSLDYGPESPLNVDQISFNNLKEKVEIAISGEEGGVTGGQGEQSTDIVFHLTAGKDVAKPDVSFEAMVVQSSRGVSVCGTEGMVGHSSRGVSVCGRGGMVGQSSRGVSVCGRGGMVGQSSRGVSVCRREGMVGQSSRGVSVCVGHYCN